jgi:hypothetical protein
MHFSGWDSLVRELYALAQSLPRCGHLSPRHSLPRDGVYLFFERGERVRLDGQSVDRIVRVGTHKVDGRFRERIRQHYGRVRTLGGDRSGSVFRKHVGGALLRRAHSEVERLAAWLHREDLRFPEVEGEVSRTLRDRFTFVCVRVDGRRERLRIEGGLIALLARHPLGGPSDGWLGHCAFAAEIRSSGLWNVQHTSDQPISVSAFGRFGRLVRATLAEGWGG